MTLQRATSVDELERTKFITMDFEGRFKASFGKPQLGGSWIAWGKTSNGKTSLNMQLAKYLTKFGKVVYNSYEEGVSLSFANALKTHNMRECKTGSFLILPGEKIEQLIIRLKKRNSADIIIIDSVQHSKITKEQYWFLKKTFPNKLFIYISHAKGKEPKGDTAEEIMYDSDVKIFVDRFRAFVEGRLNEDEGVFFDIYPERSKKLWQEVE